MPVACIKKLTYVMMMMMMVTMMTTMTEILEGTSQALLRRRAGYLRAVWSPYPMDM